MTVEYKNSTNSYAYKTDNETISPKGIYDDIWSPNVLKSHLTYGNHNTECFISNNYK